MLLMQGGIVFILQYSHLIFVLLLEEAMASWEAGRKCSGGCTRGAITLQEVLSLLSDNPGKTIIPVDSDSDNEDLMLTKKADGNSAVKRSLSESSVNFNISMLMS